jgi:hypothetical protein
MTFPLALATVDRIASWSIHATNIDGKVETYPFIGH